MMSMTRAGRIKRRAGRDPMDRTVSKTTGIEDTGCGKENRESDFHAEIRAAFDSAERSVGGTMAHDYRIGAFTFRLCFAGPALIPFITPALEHLRTVHAVKTQLTVHLWDSASTGSRLRLPSWLSDGTAPAGEIRSFLNGRLRVAFQPHCLILSMLDMDRSQAFFWVKEAEYIPYYESGAPLLRIFHWWLRGHSYYLVHAAAVGLPDKAALLVGRGGSGKSTIALSCLGSRLRYAADDYCVLSSEYVPTIYSLFNSAKQDAGNMWRFPHLASAVNNPGRLETEKALLFLQDKDPSSIARSFPLGHILIPRITGKKDTVLAPASPAEAFKALAPSTVFQLHDADHSAFRMMAELVRRVPCHYLDTGTDLSMIPRVIGDLLRVAG